MNYRALYTNQFFRIFAMITLVLFASLVHGQVKAVVIPLAGDDAPALTPPYVYEVGGIGPSGGVVFYLSEGGFHGLEPSPVDIEEAPWGCFGTNIAGDDGVAIGTGAQNTADIVAGCVSAETTAADLANDYSLNGFDDWFLPSKDELNELFLQRAFLDNARDQYWSSTEIDSSSAWRHIFINSTQASGGRAGSIGVRPIRKF